MKQTTVKAEAEKNVLFKQMKLYKMRVVASKKAYNRKKLKRIMVD